VHVGLVGKHLLHAVFDVLQGRHEGFRVIVLPQLMRRVYLRIRLPRACWRSLSKKAREETYVATAMETRLACAMKSEAASAMVEAYAPVR